MKTALQRTIHEATASFIDLLDSRDCKLLENAFGVAEPVASELFQMLAEYFDGDIPPLSAPPFEKAFGTRMNGRVPMDIHELDEAGTWGVDCSLWSEGSPVEPVLHLHFSKIGEHWQLHYRYLGS